MRWNGFRSVNEWVGTNKKAPTDDFNFLWSKNPWDCKNGWTIADGKCSWCLFRQGNMFTSRLRENIWVKSYIVELYFRMWQFKHPNHENYHQSCILFFFDYYRSYWSSSYHTATRQNQPINEKFLNFVTNLIWTWENSTLLLKANWKHKS